MGFERRELWVDTRACRRGGPGRWGARGGSCGWTPASGCGEERAGPGAAGLLAPVCPSAGSTGHTKTWLFALTLGCLQPRVSLETVHWR